MGASQGEIDRVLKEVHEGVQMLDTVFNKVYAADIDVNQRVTFEAELKKEISKLQCHRDGIATWIQSSEINDNKVSASHAQALMDARKLIEREMERFEKHQFVDSAQVHSSSYLSANGTTVSWSTQGENHSLRETGLLSNSGYSHDQHVEPVLRNVEDGTNAVPTLSTSSSEPANLSQNYSGYAAYPNNDSYGYNSSGYAAYYNQYQQQSNHQYQQQSNHQYQQPANHQYQQPPDHQYQQPPNHQYQQPPNHQYQQPPNHQYQQESNHQYQQESNHQYQQQPNYQYQHQSNQFQQQSSQTYPHHVGAYQNTGAPHQPLSSLQNTGSYAGPTSYPSTYYNPGDYQTSGSYSSGTYGTQPSLWQGGQYATYSSHQYPNYTPDANTAYNSTAAAATSQYQQQSKQWEDYYKQTQTEVSCAPGTEHIVASSVSTTSYSAPSGSGGFTSSNNQMPAAYSTSWTPESTTPGSTSIQHAAASGSAPEGYWGHGTTAFQNDPPNAAQSNAHKPLEVIPTYDSTQNQHNAAVGQGSTGVYPNYFQASQGHLSSFQTVPKPPESLDSRRASKVQIPTNPRIASNVPLGLLKTDKDSTVPSPASKPAYVSVLMQNPNEKVVSHEAADSMLKAGTFPKSLRGYVERALSRCKSDGQKIACQAIMKEVIKKATVDGTLYTRDWDTEPLFPLPNMDVINNEDKQFPKPTSSVTPKHRSPTRRAKSRWEPISQEKMVDRSVNLSYATEKYGDWNNKQYSGGNVENKDSLGTKFSLSVQKSLSKNFTRPAKRLRLGDDQRAANDGNNSSDSDKEHGLTKYYSAAISLADSPEEKKRRENRSRRFDKGHGNRAGTNKFRAKGGEAGSTYARQASGLALRRTFEESEESGSRAVEDIDWNALTVKGTCQEIEKRYLRLTSAPDPATVRPEEVLEKALLMIQNSQKNYLYKCDQLKSIRQDLTVQHIRNELTVKVYETHARLAIEYGDLPEYNQCQSQLKTLYAEGIMGCDMEFAAYNLLCVVLDPSNNRELLSAMSRLSANAKKDKAVKHALSVRTAVTSGNYVMFFRLYKSAPNLNTYLMDLYVEKMRYAAIKCVCRSYRPTVPVSYLSQILGFGNALPESEANDEKEVDGVEECMDWLKAHGACLISDNPGEILLDTKASTSSLYMPEPEDAVAHGDANLAVNDFFTRSLAV